MPKQSRRRLRPCRANDEIALATAVLMDINIGRIMSKWAEHPHRSVTRKSGCFIRFIDGDKGNCAASNLAYCTPHDAFTHPDWVVDWDMDLDAVEVSTVRLNTHNFAVLYKRD